MRIKIKLELNNNKLPLNYRKLILSLIKELLKNSEIYKDIFLNSNFKPYSFSVYLPNPKLQNDLFYLDTKNISIFFSTNDYNLIIELYNNLLSFKHKELIYKDFKYKLQNINLLKEKKINSTEIIIKTLSPILIRDHNKENNKDIYFTFKDNSIDEVNNILNRNLKDFFNNYNVNSKDIILFPIKSKKQIIITNDHGDNKKNYVFGNQGIFKLSGEVSQLQFLYNVGLGSKRSYGFGLFEIIA